MGGQMAKVMGGDMSANPSPICPARHSRPFGQAVVPALCGRLLSRAGLFPMMNFSRRTMMAGGLSAGLMGMPALGAGVPKRGGSIRVATQSVSTADTLDPAKGALSTDYVRHYMLYSGLTRIGPDMIARPALAERIESADRTTWHITLRRGVHFHHGGELTSADVVFSCCATKTPSWAAKWPASRSNLSRCGPMAAMASSSACPAPMPICPPFWPSRIS
jgi:hypothetical protein